MVKEPSTCEYIKDNRLCRAITEQPEGKDIRRRFCTNDPKNYCCYLCSSRENCEVSCTYLDMPRKPSTLDTSATSRIDDQISKYQEEISKLSVLLADGKIGEKSYLAATGTLEHRIEELRRIKESPTTISTHLSDSPKLSEFEELSEEHVRRPTSLWYLVPFFFGILGGILGYVATKDEDRETADSLLFFGIVWTIVLVIIYYLWLASIFSHL